MTESGKKWTITLSWRDLRDVVLFLPVVHLTFCLLFLFFYSISYGHALEVFFTPSDVFHVSFRDIAPGYLAFVLMVIVAWSIRRPVDSDEPLKIGQRSLFSLRSLLLATMGISSMALAWTAVLFGIIYWHLVGRVAISTFVLIAVAGFFLRLVFVFWKQPDKVGPVLVGAAVAPLLITAAFASLTAEQDSVATFSDVVEEQPRCGDHAILRAVGDYFLAVSKDDLRVLIDDECKVRFTLHGKFGRSIPDEKQKKSVSTKAASGHRNTEPAPR